MNIKMLFNISSLNLKKENGHKTVTYNLGDILISDDFKIKEKFLSHPKISEHLGAFALEEINTKGVGFAYKEIDLEINDSLKGLNIGEIVFSELRYATERVGTILDALWFSKDNSVCLKGAFAYSSDGDMFISSITPKRESYTSLCTIDKNILVEENDIHTALKILKTFSSKSKVHIIKRRSSTHNTEESVEKIFSNIDDDHNHDNYDRVERAMLFLGLARSQNYVPYRLSLYMPVFECLFCTDADNINYKISHRLAFYLRKNSRERKSLSDEFKQIYNIRSRFIHGDRLAKRKNQKVSYELLFKYCKYIDSVARELLIKVILYDYEEFIKEKEELDEFYDRLLFPPMLIHPVIKSSKNKGY